MHQICPPGRKARSSRRQPHPSYDGRRDPADPVNPRRRSENPASGHLVQPGEK
jgi:hypothetical protein